VAVLLENRHDGMKIYYDLGSPRFNGSYGLAGNRIIAAQEYIFCVGADPRGSKANAAREILRKWNQPIPN
jgi:hypothetical protein